MNVCAPIGPELVLQVKVTSELCSAIIVEGSIATKPSGDSITGQKKGKEEHETHIKMAQ